MIRIDSTYGFHPAIVVWSLIIIFIVISVIILSYFDLLPEESKPNKPNDISEFWHDYDVNTGNFRSYDDGDSVVIEDYIDDIIYPKTNELIIDTPFSNIYNNYGDIPEEDTEVINSLFNDSTYIKFKSGWRDCFRGNLTSNFQQGDKVRIHLHIIKVVVKKTDEFVEEALFECSDGTHYIKIPYERSCIELLENNVLPYEEPSSDDSESPNTSSNDEDSWDSLEGKIAISAIGSMICLVISGIIIHLIRKRRGQVI